MYTDVKVFVGNGELHTIKSKSLANQYIISPQTHVQTIKWQLISYWYSYIMYNLILYLKCFILGFGLYCAIRHV